MSDRLFQPVKVLLPSEEVARRISDAIRTGIFSVGSRLPSERRLAEQMEVSRPTVREAVRILGQQGVLTVRPGAGGGIYVESEDVPFDILFTMPQMRPGEIDDALEMRRLILPWVVQIATQHADDDDFERMRAAVAFGRASLPEAGGKATPQAINLVIIATMRFDLALAEATRNQVVRQLTEQLMRWVEPLRHRTLHTVDDLALSLDLVDEMLEAIERADPSRIARITERRLSILEDALEAHTGRRMRRNRRPDGGKG